VAVVKLDPKASGYLYLTYLDNAASDQVSSIAVDGSGNAYIAGWTSNSNFPVVGEGLGGTAPASVGDVRSFLTKLNPEGAVVFSVLIGGSVPSRALGVALTAQGQVLVSGIAVGSGFATTPGAYRVADSNGHWFLMELDAAASKVIFSATGIGGSSIAFDPAGNIYLAGSSPGTDYPTTPGAYQTAFVQGHICYGLCQIGFDGAAQLFGLQAMVGQCSAAVENAALVNGFVYQVDVRLPGSLLPCATSYTLLSAENSFPVTLSYNSAPVGPLTVPSGGAGPIVNFAPGQPMPMIVWVTK
jgi:hypothetical protein